MENGKRRRRRRVLLAVIVSLVAAACLAVTIPSLVISHRYAKAMERARTAGIPTSQEELDAFIAPVEESAAKTYWAAFAILDEMKPERLPEDIPFIGRAELPEDFREPLDPAMLEQMRGYVGERKEALGLLRKARVIKNCRFVDGPLGYDTLLPHVSKARRSTRLLMVAALAAAEDGRGDDAVEYVRDSLAIARAVDQEPILVSQTLANAMRSITQGGLQRVLAKAYPCDEVLALLQADILAAAEKPYFADAWRTEVGANLVFLQRLDEGDEIAFEVLRKFAAYHKSSGASHYLFRGGFVSLLRWMPSSYFRIEAIEMVATEAPHVMAAADGSRESFVRAAEGALDAEPSRVAIITRGLSSDHSSPFQQVLACQARMRTAAAGVALLRFLNGNGRPSETLEALVPKYLDRVPLDPWTGAPLVYKTFDDRILIYPAGQGLIDAGGHRRAVVNSEDNREKLGHTSFCLWLPGE